MLIKKLRFPYKLDPTNSIQFILRQSTGKKRKILPTMVILKINFVQEYQLKFWSPYYAFFRFLGKKYDFFHQYRSLIGGFENQFQKRFDDDIFFTKIKVAKMFIFRKKNKNMSNSAHDGAVCFPIIHFSKILNWHFLFQKN